MITAVLILGPEWFLNSLLPKPPGSGSGQSQPAQPRPDPFALPPVRQEIHLEVANTAGNPARPDYVQTVASGLGQTGASLEEMIAAIATFAEGVAKDQIEIVILPGGKVPYRDVVKIHEACERIGIGRVGVGVTPEIGKDNSP